MIETKPLVVERASVAFREGDGVRLALDGASLQLSQGERVAVIGGNGSGKSTLLKVLAGLIPLSRGTLAAGWTEGCRKAIVLQNAETQLLGETIEEDLLFSLEQAATPLEKMEEMVEELLRSCNLAGLEKLPLHFLSSGQKQLAAIAGSLATGAKLLLFDEAAAHLESGEAERMMALTRSWSDEGRTVVWITQDPREAAAMERVIALRAGSVFYDGTAAGFFYGENGSVSPCEQLGLEAPYPVQLAHALAERGVRLTPPPLSAETFLAGLTEWTRKDGEER